MALVGGVTAGLGLVGGIFGISAMTVWRIVRPSRTSRTSTWRAILDPLDIEAVSFVAVDGTRLRGWLVPPPPGGPIVVTLHGFGNNRHEFEDFVPWLSNAGYGVLLFDFRAHGESDGSFTTVAGDNEVADGAAAIAFLKHRYGPDVRLALIGISMGGAVALRLGGTDPCIRAVVTDCAFATMSRVLDFAFNVWIKLPPSIFRMPVTLCGEVLTGVNIIQLRPVDDVPKIGRRPFLVIHNTGDTAVNPED
ncbi:MAG: alpha/beta fold hydrolase, partial [Proteobacteria bacterium]|nr:alpha/beta fold hydrolase [Pseudomonadota bacterium]